MAQDAKFYDSTLRELEEDRNNWESGWEDLSRYIAPMHGVFMRKASEPRHESIKDRWVYLLDDTAARSIDVAAAGLLGGLTSPSRPWVRVAMEDDDMMEFGPVKSWCHLLGQKLLAMYGRSNLYSALPLVYKEELVFAIGSLLVEEDFEYQICCHTPTVGQYCIETDHRGLAVGMWRRIYMTAKQIVGRWGKAAAGDEVARNADAEKVSWHQVGHCIRKNPDFDGQGMTAERMAWESVYWLWGKTEAIIKRSGYAEQPFMTPRWKRTEVGAYGYSPGYQILGHSKELQEYKVGRVKAIHQETEPAMIVPANFAGRLSMIPGAQNIDPSIEERKGIRRLFDFRFDYTGIVGAIEDTRQQIREGCFNDLFRMLIDRPGAQPPTAAEIAARLEEKGQALIPVIEANHFEMLNILNARAIGILMRQGALPEPPQEIQGQNLKLVYVSVLAQAQKLIGLQGIDMLFGFVGNLAAAKQDPTVWDKVDVDEAIDEYGEAVGVAPRLVVPDDRVAEIRQARAQAQEQAMQAQQMAQGAQVAGGLAKDLSASDPAKIREMLGVTA